MLLPKFVKNSNLQQESHPLRDITYSFGTYFVPFKEANCALYFSGSVHVSYSKPRPVVYQKDVCFQLTSVSPGYLQMLKVIIHVQGYLNKFKE